MKKFLQGWSPRVLTFYLAVLALSGTAPLSFAAGMKVLAWILVILAAAMTLILAIEVFWNE